MVAFCCQITTMPKPRQRKRVSFTFRLLAEDHALLNRLSDKSGRSMQKYFDHEVMPLVRKSVGVSEKRTPTNKAA